MPPPPPLAPSLSASSSSSELDHLSPSREGQASTRTMEDLEDKKTTVAAAAEKVEEQKKEETAVVVSTEARRVLPPPPPTPASPPKSKKERLLARMATPSPLPSATPPRTPTKEQADASLPSTPRTPSTPTASPTNTTTTTTSPSTPSSSPSSPTSPSKWTTSEDAILRRTVALHSGKNWKTIARSLPHRTDVQCLHRWQKVLRPGLVKGPWTAAEDDRLVALVEEHGVKRWSFLAKQLSSGRLGKQCRERWYNHLDPSINKGAWTREEDDAIVKAYENLGSKWAQIARVVGRGRTDNGIKNRWNSMLRRVVKGEIERPSYEEEMAKAAADTDGTDAAAVRRKRSRESSSAAGPVDDIDYELLSKDRSQCTPAELDQIRRERNRMHARRSRERKRARAEAALSDEKLQSIRKVSTATPPPNFDAHASSAPSTPSTLATIKSIRSDLSDDDAIAAEALSALIATPSPSVVSIGGVLPSPINTKPVMSHAGRSVSITNTPSSTTSSPSTRPRLVISYSSDDSIASTSTGLYSPVQTKKVIGTSTLADLSLSASGANRVSPPSVRHRREEVSAEGGMVDVDVPSLAMPTMPPSVERHPQPPSLGVTRRVSRDEFLNALTGASGQGAAANGGEEDAVGLLLHFNNHTRSLKYNVTDNN